MLNWAVISGLLADDPELLTVGALDFCKFTLNVKTFFRWQASRIGQETAEIRCLAIGAIAKTFCIKNKKGDYVCCYGRIRQNGYYKDGKHRQSRMIFGVDRFDFETNNLILQALEAVNNVKPNKTTRARKKESEKQDKFNEFIEKYDDADLDDNEDDHMMDPPQEAELSEEDQKIYNSFFENDLDGDDVDSGDAVDDSTEEEKE